jgi:hypothetical protein
MAANLKIFKKYMFNLKIPKTSQHKNIAAFIDSVEKRYFRTIEDTGANDNALFIWNRVREELAGLSKLTIDDLPAYCSTHMRYHKIDNSKGCVRKK